MKSKQRQEYERFMSSQVWRNTRLKVLERDEYCCRMCGHSDKDGLSLQVHHSSYKNLWECQSNKLLTVCTHCHPLADQAQKRQRKRLGLTNQVRVNPSAFMAEIESSKLIVIEKVKDDPSEINSQVDRSISASNAQRANSRSAESLLKGIEGYIGEARQDRRRF